MPVYRHNFYDLFLNDKNPSPTRWYLDNAETMPARLKRLIEGRQRDLSIGHTKITGWRFSGPAGEEIVRIKEVKWASPADLVSSLDRERGITRNLSFTFEIVSSDGSKDEITRTIADIPFPTPWGTYVIKANQEYLANRFVQKTGIFPVNLQEVGKPDPSRNGILWHTATASLLQTNDRIVVIARTLSDTREDGFRGKGRNKAVVIPKLAWNEFDSALAEARLHDGIIPLDRYPAIAKAYREAHGIHAGTDIKTPFTNWLQEIGHARVVGGNWEKRLERLDAPEINQFRGWSIKAAKAADGFRQKLPQGEFIPFSSLARMKVQTAADIMAEMLAQLISTRIVKDSLKPRGAARAIISQIWNRNWSVTRDMIESTRTGTDRNVATIANEKTVVESAMRTNSILREGHLFGMPDGISEVQRQFHVPSCRYYISALTMENEGVGNVLHLLSRTIIDASTGELSAPFGMKEKGESSIKWLGHEDLEVLQATLAAKGLGLADGKPENISDREPTNLMFNGQVITSVPREQIPAWFDATPEDCLSLPLRMSPGNVEVEPARHSLALAFMAGASSCKGSEPDPEFSEDSRKTCEFMLNTGKLINAPADGIVTVHKPDQRKGLVTITTKDGDVHEIPYPVEIANSFSNRTGLVCCQMNGAEVTAGMPLLVPDQACVINSIEQNTLNPHANFRPGVFPAVPLIAAQYSVGEEDLLVISKGVMASGKLDIEKTSNAVSLLGREGDIRLAVNQPGTVILPGMLLGWQKVITGQGLQQWEEVRANDGDRGVLVGIQVFPDRTGQGGTLEPPPTENRPDKGRFARELVAGVMASFADIADEWDPKVVNFFVNQGADPRVPYETAQYVVWSAAKSEWESKSLTLAGLRQGPGNAEYDDLVAALVRPKPEVIFGNYFERDEKRQIARNPLETRLHYALGTAARVNELIDGEPSVKGFVPGVNRIVFMVSRDLTLSDGDKATALGTKGSIKLVHPQELPMSLVSSPVKVDQAGRPVQEVQSAELAYSVLGFLARSSYGDLKVTATGPHATTKDCVVFDKRNGLLTVPVMQGIYRALRQGDSNPETASSSKGMLNRNLDLSKRNSGFSKDGQAVEGRKGNRADHTLAAAVRPALETSYVGQRDGSTFLRDSDRIRSELAGNMPVGVETGFVLSPQSVEPARVPAGPAEPLGPGI